MFWGNDDPRNVSERLEGRQTNNRAEIQAARRAIKQAKCYNYDEIEVITDSDFLFKSMTNYIHKWQQNGFRKSDGTQVINRIDFIQLLQEMDNIDCQWIKCPSHSGVYGNIMADKLAKMASTIEIGDKCQMLEIEEKISKS